MYHYNTHVRKESQYPIPPIKKYPPEFKSTMPMGTSVMVLTDMQQ
jgi:hypothetical protein